MRFRLMLLLVLLMSGLVIAACGEDDASEDGDTTAPEDDASADAGDEMDGHDEDSNDGNQEEGGQLEGAHADEPMSDREAAPDAASEDMSVAVSATPDPMSGVNVHVTPTGFTWSPENASMEHVDGEGHAHLYVDGEKVGRLYGEWVHLALEPGEYEIEVTLNGNDHEDYVVDGEVVAASVTVEVLEPMGGSGHGH